MYTFLLELKHFGLEIIVIQRILEHIVLNNSECIFWYICTKIRKKFFFALHQNDHSDFKCQKTLKLHTC